MSVGGGSQQSSFSSKKSRYIWDEWGDGDGDEQGIHGERIAVERLRISEAGSSSVPQHAPSLRKDATWNSDRRSALLVGRDRGGDAGREDSDEDGTVSSIGLGSAAAATEVGPSSSSRSMDPSSTISAVKAKVHAIKSGIAESSHSIRNLQEELVNLQAVKENRRKRFHDKHTREMEDLRAEQQRQLQKLQDFQSKLAGDMKKLESQHEELDRRLAALQANRPQQLEQEQLRLAKRAAQARKQWETEDHATFAKALAQRDESIKKAAASALTPRLEGLVQDQKIELEKLRQEHQARLHKLRLNLSEQARTQVDALKRRLLDEIQEDIQRAKTASDKRIGELKESHRRELHKLRDAHQEAVAEAARVHEAAALKDSEAHRQAMAALQRTHNEATQALLADQQQQLAQLLQSHTQALASAKETAAAAVKRKQDEVGTLLLRRQDEAFQDRLRELTANLAREKEEILARLRSEHGRTKEERRAAIHRETDDLRTRVDEELAKLRDAEQRSLQRVTALRVEIASFASQLDTKREAVRVLEETKSEGQLPQLQALRSELQSYERAQSMDEFEPREHEERQRLAAQEREARERLQKLQRQSAELKEQLRTRKEHLDSDYHNELARIEGKITAVLARKDDQLKTLRLDVERLREENRDLQRQVEEKRDQVFS